MDFSGRLAIVVRGFAVWLRSFSGMRLGVSVEQLFEADTSVDLRGVELGVAQDGLNVSDICSRIVHQSGHGVAVDVAGSRFVDIGSLDVAATVFGQRVRFDGCAINGQEEHLLLGINGQQVAGMFDVTSDPSECSHANRYVAVLLAFAAIDE